MIKPISGLLTKKTVPNTIFRSHSRTAGVIIIGDEILKGEVTDVNSTYLLKNLYKFGVRVKKVCGIGTSTIKYKDMEKVSVVSDDVAQISEEVQGFSGRYTYVITSGGIGPTHDDVTFEAVGRAFNEALVPHPLLVDICSRYYGTKDLKCPGMKLAYIPKGAKLIFGEETDVKTSYPNISVRNVYLFPGIPQLLRKLFDQIGHKLFTSHEKFYTKVMYFNVTEKLLIEVLNLLVKEFPNVLFGSYPELENSKYKVKITMESTDEKVVQTAYNMMVQLIPPEYIVAR